MADRHTLPMEWKYSSVGVRSLAVGIASLSCGKEALAAVQPETRFALANPMSAKWHDGQVVIDSAECVKRLAGDEGVETMNFAAVKQSLGPLMSPFLSITLTLFGATPDSILKRTNNSLRSVILNVETEWQVTGPHSGLLVTKYPDAVVDVSWSCWKGAIRFVYELCGATGEIVRRREGATDRSLLFDCSWKKSR